MNIYLCAASNGFLNAANTILYSYIKHFIMPRSFVTHAYIFLHEFRVFIFILKYINHYRKVNYAENIKGHDHRNIQFYHNYTYEIKIYTCKKITRPF